MIATPDGRFAFRPGIGIGGATSRQSTLLTVRASGELQVSLSPQIGLGLEAGLWYTPSGGNELESVRIGPAKYLRAVVLVSSGTDQTVRPPRPVAVRRVQPVKPVQPVRPVQPKPDRTTDLAGSEPEQLPFQGVLKIGLSRCSKSAFRTVPTRKWFDRGLSLGVSADFTTPLLAFVGVEFGWHNLQRSESMLLGGFRGSFVSEISLGSLRFRPVGLIGLGMRSRSGTMSERTDQMVYGLSLETFWDLNVGPPLLIDFQYLKFGRDSHDAGRWSELKSLISLRLGVTL